MAALPDDPTPTLLSRLNQNINTLGSAIEEIGIWIDQRGSAETSHRINEHLETLPDNSNAARAVTYPIFLPGNHARLSKDWPMVNDQPSLDQSCLSTFSVIS